MKILLACLVHVEHREETVALGCVDTDLDLLQVGHVVLPLHRLQPRPQHPQPDGVVAHASQQGSVLLYERISRQEKLRENTDFLLNHRIFLYFNIKLRIPCIKVSGDGYKWSCLHHHVFPVENPLSSEAINDSVPFRVHKELRGPRELEKYQTEEAGASHSEQRDGQSHSDRATLRVREIRIIVKLLGSTWRDNTEEYGPFLAVYCRCLKTIAILPQI